MHFPKQQQKAFNDYLPHASTYLTSQDGGAEVGH